MTQVHPGNQRQLNIDLIRHACIAANPAIKKRGRGQSDMPCEDDPRLADVLLAMPLADGGFENVGQTGAFFYLDAESGRTEFSGAQWNLRKDDLTEQSDECLSFLAELLS